MIIAVVALQGIAPAQTTPTQAPRLEKSVQCKATTKKGEQCKKMTKNTNGFCSIHQPKK